MDKIQILLITPPYYSLRNLKPGPIYSLGVLYLAAYLREHGFESRVVISDVLTNLKPKVFIPMRSYAKNWRSYKRYIQHEDHPVWKKVEDIIRKYKPSIVGVSSNSPTIDSAYKLISVVKKIDPSICVIMGGMHGTFCTEEVLTDSSVDFVIRGEGEYPILRFVQEMFHGTCKWEKVPSLSYKKNRLSYQHNNLCEKIAELDDIPFPARDLIILPDNYELREHTILATRGCAYTCSFCCDKNFWGRMRQRSAKNIVDEIEAILNEFPKTEKIYFNDGTLTFSKPFVRELCHEINKRNIRVKFFCTARFDNIDEEILSQLKKAGFRGLYIGAESGDSEILKTMNKKITLNQIERSLRLIRKVGMQSLVSIMVGVPRETEQSLEKTIQMMKMIRADAFDINCYVPLPGSDWYDQTPEEIKKKISWLEIGYKGSHPLLFEVEKKHNLTKYIEKINKISDQRLMKTIAKVALKKLLSPFFNLF